MDALTTDFIYFNMDIMQVVSGKLERNERRYPTEKYRGKAFLT